MGKVNAVSPDRPSYFRTSPTDTPADDGGGTGVGVGAGVGVGTGVGGSKAEAGRNSIAGLPMTVRFFGRASALIASVAGSEIVRLNPGLGTDGSVGMTKSPEERVNV